MVALYACHLGPSQPLLNTHCMQGHDRGEPKPRGRQIPQTKAHAQAMRWQRVTRKLKGSKPGWGTVGTKAGRPLPMPFMLDWSWQVPLHVLVTWWRPTVP